MLIINKDIYLSYYQAQTAALAALQNLRFDKTNYFWVNDQTPTMLMHPIKPALDGKNTANVQDPNGKYLFKEMVATVQSSGSGISLSNLMKRVRMKFPY